MCVLSVVTDYMGRFPLDYWDREKFEHFRRLADQAQRVDQATGQPHCEDPAKVDILKRIEDRLTDIEKKLAKVKK